MPFPLATLGCSVDSASGITAPPFTDILVSLQASFQSIYGSDVYLGADTQDGQLLAIFAKAMDDSNQNAIATYNAFNPATATGVSLSSIVKLNGISRLIASKSSVTLSIGGVNGTVITGGQARDTSGNLWDLPTPMTIPVAGTIDVSATAHEVGAIAAPIGTVTAIANPQLGWQTVTNPSVASIGAPIETDAALRRRQTVSVALPALTVLEATVAAVSAIPGVTEVRAYENDTDAPDADGLPEHSIAIVVIGGDATAIAAAIMEKKTPGAFTYGTTSRAIVDSAGVSHNISFFIPSEVRVGMTFEIHPLVGYTAATLVTIKQAIADYINALPIGHDVHSNFLQLPAQLYGGPGSELFSLNGMILIGSYHFISVDLGYGFTYGTPDVVVAFNERATCDPADIIVTLV